ncbi:restriction endonuclease subunit S [Alphaproteobacteria bacterium]|nr:restriction endonuclease subunit S [Alphaproteobacteria bacterium]
MEIEGWMTKRLCEICNIESGKAHEPFIHQYGEFICVTSKFISSEGSSHRNCYENLKPAKENDILMVLSDLPNGRALAKCLIVGQKDDGRFAVNQRIGHLKPTKIHPKILYYLLNRNRYFLEFDDGVNQTNLSNKSIENCPLTFPSSLIEQQAIAEALSDTDALISTLEKLIEKKEMIFDAIQEKKLNGLCASNYSKYSLDELAIIDPDNLSANTDPEFYFEYISLEAVSGGQLLSLQSMRFSEAPSRARRKMKEGDVLFGTVRPNLKSHYFNRSNSDNLICSTGFCVIRPKKNIFNGYFLFRHLMSGSFDTQINKIIAGSNYPAVSSGDVRKLRISVPDISLQNEISAELEDFESEIIKLKTQLLKAKKVKAGMMQELLTGRTRLI